MEKGKLLGVILGGAVTGFSIALGWAAANKLINTVGSKKTAKKNSGTSELIGGVSNVKKGACYQNGIWVDCSTVTKKKEIKPWWT